MKIYQTQIQHLGEGKTITKELTAEQLAKVRKVMQMSGKNIKVNVLREREL